MAKGGGIWRTIRLALDRNSAKRMQDEAQKALKDATDPKAAKANLKKANSYFAETEAAVKKIATAIGAAFAIKKIAAFGLDSMRAANEAEKSWRKLGASISASGGNFARMRPDLERAAAALQDISSIDDEGFADIMQTLTSKTGDADVALKNVDLTARVAATFFKGDFAPAADLVARSLNGQTKQLKLLGIEGATTEERLRKLSARSTHDVDKFQQVANAWNNIKEEIGKALLAAGGGVSTIDTLIGSLKGFSTWISNNQENIKVFANQLGIVVSNFAQMAMMAVNATAAVTRFLNGTKKPELISKEDLQNAGHFRSIYAHRPGTPVPPPPAAVPLTPAEIAAAKKRAEEMAKIAEAARLKAALFATRMVTMNDIPGRGMKSVGAGNRIAGGGAITGGAEALFGGFSSEAAQENFRRIQDAGVGAAMGIAGAFQDAFELMLQGFDNTGKAASTFVKGVAGALLGGMAQFFSGKVTEHIAAAMGAAAYALGFTSHGNFVSAGAAWASAAKHTATAAAYAAAGGASGAGQSAIAGGGRGGQSGGIPSGARDPGGRLNEAFQSGGPEIHIHVDGMDPHNPRHQELAGKAIVQYQQRYGGRIIMEGA